MKARFTIALWSIVVIALDVLVIYAIAMHGRELEDQELGY